MIYLKKAPFIRDVFLAYLIKGARLTKTDEYPIIEGWMVATEPPKEIIQWDRRYDVKDKSTTAICFYCCDIGFQPILNNPKKYLDKLGEYEAIVGIDSSPYDDMPLVVQKSQIYLNLAITYFYGINNKKIIPNVRLGDDRTISSLEAYPHHTLIAIGTNGFTKLKTVRDILIRQFKLVVDTLLPTGICIYGPILKEMQEYANSKNIPLYQYDSYTMKKNKEKENER